MEFIYSYGLDRSEALDSMAEGYGGTVMFNRTELYGNDVIAMYVGNASSGDFNELVRSIISGICDLSNTDSWCYLASKPSVVIDNLFLEGYVIYIDGLYYEGSKVSIKVDGCGCVLNEEYSRVFGSLTDYIGKLLNGYCSYADRVSIVASSKPYSSDNFTSYVGYRASFGGLNKKDVAVFY